MSSENDTDDSLSSFNTNISNSTDREFEIETHPAPVNSAL